MVDPSTNEEQAQPPPHRWKLPQWESAVEQQIREAQASGAFDNLPGAGQPLPSEPWHGGEWALAFHVLRQAGETLPWIALGQEIEARQARLRRLREDATWLHRHRRLDAAWVAERERARSRYLQEAAELDKQLLDYSLLIPSYQLDKGRLPAFIAARDFDTACPG